MLVRPYVVKPPVSPLGVSQIRHVTAGSPSPRAAPSPRSPISPATTAAPSPRQGGYSPAPSAASSSDKPAQHPTIVTKAEAAASKPAIAGEVQGVPRGDDARRRRLETKLFDLLHGLDSRLRAVPTYAAFWRAVDAARERFDRQWEQEGSHSYHSFYTGLEAQWASVAGGIHKAFEDLRAEVAQLLRQTPNCRLYIPDDRRVRRECKLLLALAALQS